MRIILIFLLLFNAFGLFSQEISFKEINKDQNDINIFPQKNLRINGPISSLPYPIIFIHELNSYDTIWYKLSDFLYSKGLDFGGQINICLNDDGNKFYANKNLYPTTGADIGIYTPNIISGDFYWVNFDIDNKGQRHYVYNSTLQRFVENGSFSDMLSNESAIVKQGVALKYVIQYVLQKTGKEKVILMGHSMGGLAAREYVQNPSNWQPDSKHHVGKLVTTGTPHGGYTGINIAGTGIDEQSEAYRDLKKSYWWGDAGVYLFGGKENYSTMKNNLLYDFYNVDVNCNGLDADESTILGLNEKSWVTSIDYSYIIGVCTDCGYLQGSIEGDGIVRSENANLSNFTNELPAPVNQFIYTAAAKTIKGLHSDLPEIIPVNMQGLDEPGIITLSYDINLNQEYRGFITVQSNETNPDIDSYKFTLPSNSTISATINNNFYNQLNIFIRDQNFQLLSSNTVQPFSSYNFTQNLNAGQYYFRIVGDPQNNKNSHEYPYSFKIQSTTTSTNEYVVDNSLKVYPNPAKSNVFIQSQRTFSEYAVFDILGKQVGFGNLNGRQEVNIQDLVPGTYILRLKDKKGTQNIKIVKE